MVENSNIIKNSQYLATLELPSPLKYKNDPFKFLFDEQLSIYNLNTMHLRYFTEHQETDLTKAYHTQDVKNLISILISNTVDIDIRNSAAQQLCILFQSNCFLSLLYDKKLLPLIIEELYLRDEMNNTINANRYEEFVYNMLLLLLLMIEKSDTGFINDYKRTAFNIVFPYIFHHTLMVRKITCVILAKIAFSTSLWSLLSLKYTDQLLSLPLELKLQFIIPGDVNYFTIQSQNNILLSNKTITTMVENNMMVKKDNNKIHNVSKLIDLYVINIKNSINHVSVQNNIHGLMYLIKFYPKAKELLLENNQWKHILNPFITKTPCTDYDIVLLQDILDFIISLLPALLVSNQYNDSFIQYIISLLNEKLIHLIEGKLEASSLTQKNHHEEDINSKKKKIKPLISIRYIYYKFIYKILDYCSNNLKSSNIFKICKLIEQSKIFHYCIQEVIIDKNNKLTIEATNGDWAGLTANDFNQAIYTITTQCIAKALSMKIFDSILFDKSMWKLLVSTCISKLSQPMMPNSFDANQLIKNCMNILVSLSTHNTPYFDCAIDFNVNDWLLDINDHSKGSLQWLLRLYTNRDNHIIILALHLLANLCTNFHMYAVIINSHPGFFKLSIKFLTCTANLPDEIQKRLYVLSVRVTDEEDIHSYQQDIYLDLPIYSNAVRAAACKVFKILATHVPYPELELDPNHTNGEDIILAEAAIEQLLDSLAWLFASASSIDAPEYFNELTSFACTLLNRIYIECQENHDHTNYKSMLNLFVKPKVFMHLINILDFNQNQLIKDKETPAEDKIMLTYGTSTINKLKLSLPAKVSIYEFTTSSKDLLYYKQLIDYYQAITNIFDILLKLLEISNNIALKFLKQNDFMNMVFNIMNINNSIDYIYQNNLNNQQINQYKCNLYSKYFQFLALCHVHQCELFRTSLCKHQMTLDHKEFIANHYVNRLCLSNQSIHMISQLIIDNYQSNYKFKLISICRFIMSLGLEVYYLFIKNQSLWLRIMILYDIKL